LPTNQKIEGKEEDCVSAASKGEGGFHYLLHCLVTVEE